MDLMTAVVWPARGLGGRSGSGRRSGGDALASTLAIALLLVATVKPWLEASSRTEVSPVSASSSLALAMLPGNWTLAAL